MLQPIFLFSKAAAADSAIACLVMSSLQVVENWNKQLKATVLGRGKAGEEAVSTMPLGKMQLLEVVDMLQVCGAPDFMDLP